MNTGKISRWAVVPIVGVALFGITMCAQTPEPTPTPDAVFSTEAEAFASAEETYRAYNDAYNRVDFSDPKTFEPMFALTTGEVYEADRESFSKFHAEGLVKTGDFVVTSFQGIEFGSNPIVVSARACLDVSGSALLDADGNSLVPPERPDVYDVALEFEYQPDVSRFRLSTSRANEPSTC